PFRAFRPSIDKAYLAASRSYVTYSRTALQQKLSKNPFSFLHIINPDYKKYSGAPNTPLGLKKIKEKFLEFQDKSIYIRDEKPCLYIYRQIRENVEYTGLIGCISIDDYESGVIKKHEATLAHREEKLKNYLRIVDINAEPVCMTYPRSEDIAYVVRKVTANRAEYDWSTVDGVRHMFWIVDLDLDIKQVQRYFSHIPSLYIADGHHRSASSYLLGKEKRERKSDYSGQEGFNYFMGIFFSEDNIKIMQFSRLVKDLAGLTALEFLKLLEKSFEITKCGTSIHDPKELHDISMYLEGFWYSLHPKVDSFDFEHPSENLDTAILTKNILSPILGIDDPRHDNRISYVGGIKDLKPIKRMVDSGKYEVGFAMYPVTIEQLKAIADKGDVMPPKSTWIEPKLMTGLTIYSLEETSE
ncbi:MAG: DUF1015 family protein, partial [Vicingaceae bacterium]